MLKPRLLAALAAGLAGVVLTVSLGNWQTRRGDEKALRQAHWDAAVASAPATIAAAADVAAVERRLPQRVQVSGWFVADATVYIDNRVLDGVAGYQVVTPLDVGAGLPWILVNRGWAPRNMADRTRLPAAPVGRAPARIEGLAVANVPRVLDLGARPGQLRGTWQNLDYEAYERASGHPVARFVVQQTTAAADGLRREWTRPDAGVDKHRGYAFQWYALAALIAVLTLYFGGKAALNR